MNDLKSELFEFLQSDPENAYSMDELATRFHVEKWLVQRAISRLHDEGKVTLRVSQKKVYAHVRR